MGGHRERDSLSRLPLLKNCKHHTMTQSMMTKEMPSSLVYLRRRMLAGVFVGLSVCRLCCCFQKMQRRNQIKLELSQPVTSYFPFTIHYIRHLCQYLNIRKLEEWLNMLWLCKFGYLKYLLLEEKKESLIVQSRQGLVQGGGFAAVCRSSPSIIFGASIHLQSCTVRCYATEDMQ